MNDLLALIELYGRGAGEENSMSYDVWFETPETQPCLTCGHRPEVQETESHNYTSNMVGAWRAAGADLADLEYRPGAEVAAACRAAIAKIESEGVDVWSAKWNAPNGWGDIPTMLDFLVRIARDGEEHPTWRFRVSR